MKIKVNHILTEQGYNVMLKIYCYLILNMIYGGNDSIGIPTPLHRYIALIPATSDIEDIQACMHNWFYLIYAWRLT